MLVRFMQPGEETAVSRIYALAWKQGYRSMVAQEYLDALPETRWVPMLTDSPYRSLVCEQDGVLVGTSCIAPARDEALSGWGEILSCYVLPEHWGKGVGGALLREAVRLLRADGFTSLYLWVLRDNARARTFYEKHGFSATGEEAPVEIDGVAYSELRYALHLTDLREENGR